MKDIFTIASRGASKKVSSRASKARTSTLKNKINVIFNRTSLYSFIFGISVGVGLTSWIFIAEPKITFKNQNNIHTKIKQNKSKNNELAKQNKAKLEFHNLLSQRDDYDFNYPNKKNKTLDLKTKQLTSHKYMIQVGSFLDRADADELRAKLTLNGFEAKIETANLNNAGTWFRVNVGPFATESEAITKKRQLTANSFTDSLLIVQNK